MREALAARPDGDFIVSAPVRRKSSARTKAKKVGVGARLMAFVFSHPREMIAAAFLAGCGGVITYNALVLQSARHPAPLFNQRDIGPARQPLPPLRPGAGVTEPQSPAPAPAQPAALVPAAPAATPAPAAPSKLPSRGAIADLIRNGGEAAPAPPQPAKAAVVPPPAPTAAAAPVMRDPIGEIIRMGGPVPTPPANVGKAGSGDLVMSGQRALAKLGYSVKADGMMGTGTRQAIERFEQERRLPVTGDFSPRTVRELSAASGIVVQ
ncbi:peptidoglycan-binding domain-containing protein [Microvirga alba]|uniref:Peptidoglycan-binding protein n=1 Tax=Microvirga alba TaxID=2791025 RepID=A0A931BSI2_9HYPH|nr:peptidoglycan-binding domain-containing protein [Microvirga alba]MBF9232037.1 peptidoglycan-binding protein [Microvirga alba]